jgi:hypothetical protein
MYVFELLEGYSQLFRPDVESSGGDSVDEVVLQIAVRHAKQIKVQTLLYCILLVAGYMANVIDLL